MIQKPPLVRQLPACKRIALVAHDHKKKDLLDWAVYNRDALAEHELFATGTTGRLLAETLGLPVHRFLSGPLGGDLQIASYISEAKIDMLVFFWDPMEAQPHDPDVKALLRIGVVWNTPLACNPATADFLLSSPWMKTQYDAVLEDFSAYVGRKAGY